MCASDGSQRVEGMTAASPGAVDAVADATPPPKAWSCMTAPRPKAVADVTLLKVAARPGACFQAM